MKVENFRSLENFKWKSTYRVLTWVLHYRSSLDVRALAEHARGAAIYQCPASPQQLFPPLRKLCFSFFHCIFNYTKGIGNHASVCTLDITSSFMSGDALL